MDEIAARLDTARRTRCAIASFSDGHPPIDLDLELGYRVQRHRRRGRPVAGWKLALTSRAKQRQVGVDTPLYGFLDAADGLNLGQPVPTRSLIAPRAEPEIVFTLGEDLAGPCVTSADVLAATAAVMGHPAAAVAWLVRRLHMDGESGLRRGEVIFSGGLTSAVPIATGDTITIALGHLGSIVLACD